MKRKSKDEIIAEYLSGDYTFRELGTKHNIPFRTIAGWVWAYQGRTVSWREKMKYRKEKQTGVKEPELPKELKLLQKELRKHKYVARSPALIFIIILFKFTWLCFNWLLAIFKQLFTLFIHTN